MQKLIRRLSLIGSITLMSLLFGHAARGQISPDGTLPTNVDLSGNVFEINGGITTGNNLFHSFGEFSIPTGFEAFFNNGAINNIISRVTGGSISNIDGLIRANDSANLILINPAGISFGSGASLDIGGSFLGSSANSINFEDGTVFSADPSQAPLLTITAPIGVGFATNPGNIESQGANLTLESGNTLALIGGEVSLDSTNITTPSGNIEIGSVNGDESVSLTAIPQGWELGFDGVSNFQDIQFGAVSLNAGEITVQGQDVTLTASILETQGSNSPNPEAGEVSGNIRIRGQDITIAEESRLATTERIEEPQTFGPSDFIYSSFGGDIIIQGQDITISQGTEALLPTLLARGQSGAGDITIEGQNIIINEGSQQFDDFEFFNPVDTIDADSLSNQQSGTITIDGQQITISESVGITSEIWNDPESIQGDPDPNIDIGGIFIGTNTEGNTIAISDASQIITDTHGFHEDGQIPGVANNIVIGNINSQEVIIQEGTEIAAESHPHNPAAFGIRTDFDAGEAGSITISGQQVNIKGENTDITATSFGTGTGGDISIQGANITIEDQADVVAETSGATSEASGGSISIGSDITNNEVTINNATVSVTTGSTIASSHGSAGAETLFGNAPAGNIFIGNSNSTLDILDNSEISASTIQAEGFDPGVGSAGTIEIDANEFNLIQDAIVTSETNTLGAAGDISLTVGNLLNIENGSQISVTANSSGTAGNINIVTDSLLLNNEGSIISNTQTGDEGNITIESRQAILQNNSEVETNSDETSDGGNITFTSSDFIALIGSSNITANAGQEGQGGAITIDTQGVFQCGDCQIEAIGGEEGIVEIITPDVQNTLEFLDITQQVINLEDVVVSACGVDKGKQESQFTITGRGGLPPRPTSSLATEALIGFDSENEVDQNAANSTEVIKNSDLEQLPSAARGWYLNPQGNLVLTASIAHGNPYNSGVNNPDCDSVSHNN